MAIELFGFKIGRAESEQQPSSVRSFAAPVKDDGAVEIAPGGMYGTYVDLEGTAKTEAELVNRYRDMIMQPECDIAVDDIVNEAIVYSEEEPPVQIVLDKTDLNTSTQNKHKKYKRVICGIKCVEGFVVLIESSRGCKIKSN